MRDTWYIVIPPDENIVAGVGNLRRFSLIGGPGVRWVPVATLHLTALYIGAADDRVSEKFLDALSEVAAHTEPFTMECREVGYAPPREEPKTMLWLYFEANEPWRALTKSLARAFDSICTPADTFLSDKREGKDLYPHMTLMHLGEVVVPASPRLRRSRFVGQELSVRTLELVRDSPERKYQLRGMVQLRGPAVVH